MGSILLTVSHAATSTTADYEAEAGTRSGNASLASGSGASGGSAVKFSSTASACPVSTPNVPDGPDPWGGCFPGPASTGYPHGLSGDTRTPVTLTAYTGSCTVTTANTVIDSKTISCSGGMDVRAANVTIKNSKITDGISVNTEASQSYSLTLQDTEVYGGPHDLPTVGIGNLTIIRANLYGGHNGLQCDEFSLHCLLQDSYIHGQYQPPTGDSHLGGLLSDGTTNFTITHNSVFCDAVVNVDGGGCTGDINLIPNFAEINGANITYNLLGANTDSSYCTYGGEKPPSATPHSYNIVYQHNIFQKGTTGHCAAYGPVTDFKFTNTGNVWTDNKYDDGTVINCTAADECM